MAVPGVIGAEVNLASERAQVSLASSAVAEHERLRRLSPLVEPASGSETLVCLQTADAGILLAPEESGGGGGI